jgi:hypothetical protein
MEKQLVELDGETVGGIRWRNSWWNYMEKQLVELDGETVGGIRWRSCWWN